MGHRAYYPDETSQAVLNRVHSGLDGYPLTTREFLGPDATVKDLNDYAYANFSKKEPLRLTKTEVLERFVTNWRKYFDWRYERGTSVEEYRRIDAMRAERKQQTQA